MMSRLKKILVHLVFACLLLGPVGAAPFSVAHASERYASHRGFDDEYVFATTRSVNDMDMNPALKLTLFPVTLVLDTVFLPFAVIAGFVA